MVNWKVVILGFGLVGFSAYFFLTPILVQKLNPPIDFHIDLGLNHFFGSITGLGGIIALIVGFFLKSPQK